MISEQINGHMETEIGEWTPDYDGDAYVSEIACNERQAN